MHDPVLVTNPARPRDHGSGFVIRRLDGDAGVHVLTCAHVVRALGADGLRVADQPAQVVIDLGAQGIDLAVLSVAGLTDAEPLALGRGVVGEEVELLGFEPAGGGPLAVPHRGRLAKSSLTALGGRNRPAWHLELSDGEIEGGHSGGPVISVRTGKIVGVIAMGPDQQGGRDGVAVAIENLAVWPQAPTIAAVPGPVAVAPIDPDVESGSSTDTGKRLPRIHYARWIAIGGVSLVAAVVVAFVVQPAATPAPSGCAIPDLRDGYGDVRQVGEWCPDAVRGDTACVRNFDDGSVIAGRCLGTDPSGDWSARDGTGFVRWTARFGEPGRHPTAQFTQTTRLPSGAVEEIKLINSGPAATGGGFVDSSTSEIRCTTSGGFASVVRKRPDRAAPDVEVTLIAPGATMQCDVQVPVGIGVVALGPTDLAILCKIEEAKVVGQFAVDSYQRLLSAERLISSCNLPPPPTLAQCGDRKKGVGEECDDGGESATCNRDCTLARHGDGKVNQAAGEACDDGGETAGCNADGTLARCGDGQLNHAAGEDCDPFSAQLTPRNRKDCDLDCTRPTCGDGLVNLIAREQCDPGASAETAACTRTCSASRCGDRYVNAAAGEQCDPPRGKLCTDRCLTGVSPPGMTPHRP